MQTSTETEAAPKTRHPIRKKKRTMKRRRRASVPKHERATYRNLWARKTTDLVEVEFSYTGERYCEYRECWRECPLSRAEVIHVSATYGVPGCRYRTFDLGKINKNDAGRWTWGSHDSWATHTACAKNLLRNEDLTRLERERRAAKKCSKARRAARELHGTLQTLFKMTGSVPAEARAKMLALYATAGEEAPKLTRNGRDDD